MVNISSAYRTSWQIIKTFLMNSMRTNEDKTWVVSIQRKHTEGTQRGVIKFACRAARFVQRVMGFERKKRIPVNRDDTHSMELNVALCSKTKDNTEGVSRCALGDVHVIACHIHLKICVNTKYFEAKMTVYFISVKL